MSSTTKNVVVVLVITLMSAAAVFLYGRYDERMAAVAKASLEWPSVTGLVTHSNLEARRIKVGAQRNQMRYHIEVDYEYIVDDERYENDIVRFNQDKLSRSEKELLVSAHPVGHQVEVFYNPSDPKESVLVRGSYP